MKHFLSVMIIISAVACQNNSQPVADKSSGDSTVVITDSFPDAMVKFVPYETNPVFGGTGGETWDKKIRERGFILFEDSVYKMWYTGYKVDNEPKFLGYATSADGIRWNRYKNEPIFKKKWTEDVFIVKNEGVYYMYAEGDKDVAHLLTSKNGIDWEEQGDLVILKANGDTIPGPFGTPTVWVEDGKWRLFYERMDEAIWVAGSSDHRTWKNISDEPVIKAGPDEYDAAAVAANQVIKYQGKYYLHYHASSDPNWAKEGSNAEWTSNIAMSEDLIHWTKYPGNPIIAGDHSSAITVFDGTATRLYAMHPEVFLYFSKQTPWIGKNRLLM